MAKFKRIDPSKLDLQKYFEFDYSAAAISTALREAELSFSMEKERYDSLVAASARILTAVSILMVALSTLYKLCMDRVHDIQTHLYWADDRSITVAYLVLLVPLLVSLLFALLSQYRFGYRLIGSPTELLDTMMTEDNNCMTSEQAQTQYVLTLVEPYHSIEARNDRIMSYLRRSVVFAVVSLILGLLLAVAALLVAAR